MLISCGFASRSCFDQPPCGDGWLSREAGPILRVMVADGIGHGSHAHQIVQSLQQQLAWICKRSVPMIGLAECMVALNQCLNQHGPEAQAAVALADLNRQEQRMDALVVGNIEVHCQRSSGRQQITSLRGMVGGRFPGHLPVTHWALEAGTLVGLFSDGLESAGALMQLTRLHERGRQHHLDVQAEAETMVHCFGKASDDSVCALLHLGEAEA